MNDEREDPYLNTKRCLDRLKEEYIKYGSLFVAFDFDNTVFDYHKKGFTFPSIEKRLRECKEVGFKLILFTAKETEEELKACADYCAERGYAPDFINECPVMKTSKPYYNILLDDRAGLVSASAILDYLILDIKNGEI